MGELGQLKQYVQVLNDALLILKVMLNQRKQNKGLGQPSSESTKVLSDKRSRNVWKSIWIVSSDLCYKC